MNKKIKYLSFYIIFAFTIILILIGTFFDLEIASMMYISRDNAICKFFAGVGIGLPFLVYPIFGGYLFSDALYHQEKKILRLLLLCYGIGMTLCSYYVAVHEFCSYDAYNITKNWIVFLIVLPIVIGLFIIGYIKGIDNKVNNIWIVLCLTAIVVVITYIGFVKMFKNVMNRPRYREMIDGKLSIDLFHKFFEPFKETKYYVSMGVRKEEFESFPSGHASASCLMIMMLSYLPIVFKKLESKRKLLFYIGLVYCILISITRMLVGAHFLTDICFGFLSTFIIIFVFNLIVDKKIMK